MAVIASPEEMEAALARAVVPVEVVRASPGFGGEVTRRDFGAGVALIEGGSRAAVLARTPQLIDASPSDGLVLEVNVRGRSVVAQRGRQAVLRAGEGALYDARWPYRIEFPEENRAYLVHVPRARLPYTDGLLGGVVAQRVDASLPSYRVLQSYVGMLRTLEGIDADRDAAGLARRTLADLVCTVISALAGRGAGGSREVLLSALQVTVARELSDPALSPATLARGHHVSLRTVHAAFELTSTTPAAYIRDQRLRRASELLRDPGVRIIDVALACGFRSPTTFARAFAAAQGVAPSAFRDGESAGIASRPDR